jgi:23S rRNA (uridine2552-2'-O)-methyltransferase
MSRTKHGHSWILRHIHDPYVKKAQKQGYRSRASFKLLELHQKDKLFRTGMKVVDLGASPGGWSQVVAECVGVTGKIIALDILEMEPLKGVTFLQGDFTEHSTAMQLSAMLEGEPLDWVISDLSPNISGITSSDQPKIIAMADMALDFAKQHLKKDGGFLVKIFQGEGFDSFFKSCRASFKTVTVRKPDASRSSSRELYVLARGYYNI